MNKDEILKCIEGRLIVSCQALPGEPLYDEEKSLMPYMAMAAKRAGSPLIRTNSVRDVIGIRKVTGLPVIGLIKKSYEGYDSYITATMKEIDELAEAEADIIALDMTDRKRGDGKTAAEFFREVRKKYPDRIFLADISNADEGRTAAEAGVDLVSTTMSGYTDESPQMDGPDFKLVEELARELKIPVLAEGRIHTPEDAVKMLDLGAWAVIVGGAITRPLEIAERFISAIEGRRRP
jgi:N-acylglucosamine-6-phosphate 2-epimerase